MNRSSSITMPLRTLCTLRWVAIAGQVVAVWLAVGVLRLEFPLLPLAAGIAALAFFNLYATLRSQRATPASSREIVGHLLADILVLTWLVAWSGGIGNPFSSMFLIIIALAALVLPLRGLLFIAAACVVGYVVIAVWGHDLPHMHGDSFNLHLWGMAANFLLSAMVVLYFSSRLVAALRAHEHEVAMLRERYARNEGIVALATHAAAVAHELNTPLATMTLQLEEMEEVVTDPATTSNVQTMRLLVEVCRDRLRELVASADMGAGNLVNLERVIESWQLLRPAVQLLRQGERLPVAVDPAIGHLLQALLNNAADASLQAGSDCVELKLVREGNQLSGEVRDYGNGFHAAVPFQPEGLFHSTKADGMGMGLALSHATVERLGGQLGMRAQPPRGVLVSFRLPIEGVVEGNA